MIFTQFSTILLHRVHQHSAKTFSPPELFTSWPWSENHNLRERERCFQVGRASFLHDFIAFSPVEFELHCEQKIIKAAGRNTKLMRVYFVPGSERLLRHALLHSILSCHHTMFCNNSRMKPEPQQFSVDVNKKAPFLSHTHRERHSRRRERNNIIKMSPWWFTRVNYKIV